ncbi:MAG: DEAD/DEAH box helicase family protein, partial [Mobilitalea sp.]
MNPKDFQQATADRILKVFREGQHRILLADEVGLGKTIIARDVIRQVSEWHRLEKKDDHFKVIYICSNINIVNQNSKKLGIHDLMNISESRLSMQHLKIYQNKGNNHSYEQLIPLTPATSFTMTSGCGNQEERALMYAHIKRLPVFSSYISKLYDFLAYDAEKYWRFYIDKYENEVINCEANGSNYIREMSDLLSLKLQESHELVDNIISNCASHSSSKKAESRPLINVLRKIFAQISLEKLEPDLVIMDEFQRFRDLISPTDDEQGMLTKQFLQDTNTKVLLLSATPYKPYSTLEEISLDENAEHYKEFMEVMKFLFYDQSKLVSFHQVWKDYSNSLCELNTGNITLLLAQKNSAEDSLYQGICRTERLNSGIIDDSAAREVSISTGDILSYSEMQTLLDAINKDSKRSLRYHNVPMDYIKSSPYLLSFMESYQLKKEITDYFKRTKKFDLVTNTKYLLIKKNAVHNYQPIAANNARFEKLKDVIFANGKNGAENLLWLPPSKSYYTTGSIYDKNKNYSKLLVFSSWEMVPRMISLMLSYEAERLTIGKLFHGANTKRGRGYFASKEERRYGITRLKNETDEILCYVSRTLARIYQPDNY